MMMRVRWLGIGTVGLAMGVGLLAYRAAAGPPMKRNCASAIRKLAETIEKKDSAAVKKQVTILAKQVTELEDLMALFQARTGDKGGLGVGPKAGAITPDGIEDKVESLGKKPLPEKELDKEADALAQMGYQVAAVIQVAHAKAPEKDDGAEERADWLKFAEQTEKAALDFAAVARKKNAADLHKAAKKLDASCSTCHDVFKK